MGRVAQGFRVKPKRGWFYVHFFHEKTEHRIALGTKDPREASERAATEYAAVVSGRRRAGVERPAAGAGSRPLDVLLAEWIASLEGALDEQTRKTLETYARHFVSFFGTLDRMTEPSCRDYGRARLRQVLRKTVQKENVYLRAFLQWAEEQREIAKAPIVADLPKKSTGKRAGKQRAVPVDISEEQAESILAQLPAESKTIAGRPWPIRDRFAFAWETGLRPGSVELVSVPEHWAPGRAVLVLEDTEDKARYGRTLPLSARAVAILERNVPPDGAGLVFGRHNFNKALKHAGRAVLGEEEGKRFAAYDFRHGRSSFMVNSGAPLLGVSYLLGHKRASTTDKYLRGNRRAAERALAAVGAMPIGPDDGKRQPVGESVNRIGEVSTAVSAADSRTIPGPAAVASTVAVSQVPRNIGWPTGFEPATPGATTQRSDGIPNDSGPSLRHVTPANDPIRPDSRTGCGFAGPFGAERFDRIRATFERLAEGDDEP